VEIQVTNDGPPIPTELGEKIFEPFFTTRSFGTGLGLPISYQIIVSNGGALDFRCENGKTTFVSRFPALSLKGKTDAELTLDSHPRNKPSLNADL
jgi:nitrogen-specific signal transduction histidine kinase